MIHKVKMDPTVCSDSAEVELSGDNTIISCRINGGCPGNQAGICSLIVGMRAEEVISRFEGIRCGGKSTSCPDQLAKILKSLLN